jgi:hypothetical protein
MNFNETCRIEPCDAILLAWDLCGLTPKNRRDHGGKAAEFVNKDMPIFMRSEKITGDPLLHSIRSCIWMQVSFITSMVPNLHGFQMEIVSNDAQGRAGVGVACTPSWKQDGWWAHA